MEKKKLGILLSTPPSHPSVTTTVRLCEEALRSNVDVYLYLIDEGVLNLHDHRLRDLSSSGVKFFVCAYGCQQHGVATDDVGKEITLCGLVVLSNMINGCDRFVAFNQLQPHGRAMLPSIALVIREDPLKTHRAVEALRIALGLSTGGNPLTIILLGRTPLLLAEDSDDIVDGDILEKYLPSLKQLEIPFVVPSGARSSFSFDPGFKISESSPIEITALVASSDRVLIF